MRKFAPEDAFDVPKRILGAQKNWKQLVLHRINLHISNLEHELLEVLHVDSELVRLIAQIEEDSFH